MTRWHFLALAAIPLLLNFLRPAPTPELVWWTTYATDKVRPDDAAPVDERRSVKIFAARNEFEPFQVVLRSDSHDVAGIDVEVTDLRNGAAIIPAASSVTVYLERFLDVKTASSSEGRTGEWPDPLIPRIDSYAREKRSAFPFRLIKGRSQPIWVDVYVPPGAKAGVYRGEVRLNAQSGRLFTIPVELEVWNFELPSTSTLVNTFGFSGIMAVRSHFGRYTTDQAVADITTLYQKAGLRHRVTLDGSSSTAPLISSGRHMNVDWDAYDAQIGPFLDGKVFSGTDSLPGAKATSVVLHPPPSLTEPDSQIEYWRQIARHFRDKGWLDRLFVYLLDEPNPSQFAKVAERGRTVKRAEPGLKTLITAPLHTEWMDFIDIWSPALNCLEKKPNHDDYCKPAVARDGYDEEINKGKRLWWYQACNTHGCNAGGGGNDYFTGWPSYMIDHSGVSNRIMEWITWKYGVGGELYFNTNEAFRLKDPWKDIYLFGGNGDGTLFYPGRPDIIGGRTNIPIESIRLKLIREGMEDYEYLAMVAKLRGKNVAMEVADSLVHRTYDFDSSTEKLYAARQRLAAEIMRK